MKTSFAVLLAVLVLAAIPGAAETRFEVDNPAEPYVSTPAPLTSWRTPEVVLYDNGPLVNSPGTGAGGADESMRQITALGMTVNGFGNQFSAGNRLADDFVVTDASGWTIDTITFFQYQTDSPTTSTITGLYVQIWDGPPDAGGTVVWGDLTTNRIQSTTWPSIYRVSDTTSGATNRPVMVAVATIGTNLAQGTYWVDWMADGSLASGPWAPPITINGQATTGNALQFTTTGWGAITDTGSGTAQGLPFIIDGAIVPVELQSFQIE